MNKTLYLMVLIITDGVDKEPTDFTTQFSINKYFFTIFLGSTLNKLKEHLFLSII